MTDHNDAPDEHLPEGANLSGTSSENGPAPETMIGEGEPLPVGAHAPDAPKPVAEPPGTPKPPDDLDREMAREAQALYDGVSVLGHNDRPYGGVRPDQASLSDARTGLMLDGLSPVGVRQALLTQVRAMAEREREAILAYARAVREREEQREVYQRVHDARLAAEEALHVLGLDTEADHPAVEPTPDPAPIPDSMIV